MILNPVIVITHVDASGMGLRGWGVKSGGGPGLVRTETGIRGGARTSIGGAGTSIGSGGVSTIGKSVGVTARPSTRNHCSAKHGLRRFWWTLDLVQTKGRALWL
jgi:hypothetical protein